MTSILLDFFKLIIYIKPLNKPGFYDESGLFIPENAVERNYCH